MSKQNIAKRIVNYDKDHCWQYEIRKRKLEEDKERLGLTDEDIENLDVQDFEFRYIDKKNKEECQRVKKFIKRYEWLGKTHIWSTHRFGCYLDGELGGVVIMSTPNSFSNLLGKDNKDKEKLISRGACASWTPKNLASWLISKSIDWMTDNTRYRLFTAYSDPEAKELGTIYQACNFYYLGQTSGTKKVYYDPKRPHLGWISSRSFTYRSCYVNYAKELGIEWQYDDWYRDGTRKIDWNKVPDDIEEKLKTYAKEYRKSCESRKTMPKHKYGYVQGKNSGETRYLRRKFEKLNPEVLELEYPKNRGTIEDGS